MSDDAKPLRRDAARNRELVLSAARSVFAEHGVDGGFEEIARRAGVGVGTVYRRFPTRDSLIEALFEMRLADLTEVARACLDAEDSWTGLRDFVARTVEVQIADRGLRDVLIGPKVGDARLTEAKASLVYAVEALVARAQHDRQLRPDIEGADLAVLGGMLSDLSTTDNPELWRRYLNIFLDGMRADLSHLSVLAEAGPDETTLDSVAESVSKRVESGRGSRGLPSEGPSSFRG